MAFAHCDVGAALRSRRLANRNASRALLLFKIARHPVTAVYLKKRICVSERTAFRLIGRFDRDGLIVRCAGGWVLKRDQVAA